MTPPPDAPLASPAPAWLDERRRAVADRLGEPLLPSTDEEVWRYSRVADIDLADWAPVTDVPPPGIPGAVSELLETLPDRAATVVVRNGFVVHAEIAPAYEAKGLFAGRLVDGPTGDAALGSVAGEGPDVFAALNDARLSDPVLVSVPAGVAIDRPVVVVDWVDADGAVVYPRLVVRSGADSEVKVLDWHGSADVAALVAPVIELDVARAARLGYTNVQLRGPRVWQVASQLSRVDADGTLTSAQAGLGGEYARTRTDCHLVGRGATGNLQALYFGENSQTLDFRTFQQHAAPDTTSNLLFKGAVGDQSRSVYTGLIKVREGGPRHERLPDQPQPEALRRRLGRVGAQPRDRDQRRALQPRLHGRTHRPRAALLPREPRCAHRGRRAAHRRRLLRRGARGPARRRRRAPRGRGHPGAVEPGERALMLERLCSITDVADGEAKRFELGKLGIAVVRLGDDWYAIGDRCTHQNISLAEGEVNADTLELECWKHGSCFSLVDGHPSSLPATKPTPVFTVKIEGDDVFVEVD